MKLTLKVKLLTTEEQKASLIKTMEVFNEACNFVSKIAFEVKKFGHVDLHHLCYRYVRENFKLSAQLTVRAIGKVSESYRAKSSRAALHVFKPHSAIVYDGRILSFKGMDTVSILSLDGRFKIPLVCYEYANLHRRIIKGQADMILYNNELYLCLCIEVPDGTPISSKGILGIDMGIVNLAVTSDGEFFSGQEVENTRVRYSKLRKNLQSCGTTSAKKHLKKISKKESNFKRNINHVISKKIVSKAKDTQRAIALENLKGFSKTVSKAQRDKFGKWAFYQLRSFIEYKAKLFGVPVIAVSPVNTSRTCPKCGNISKHNRKSQSLFSCEICSYTSNADFNGAINIARRASINMPIVVQSLISNFLLPEPQAPLLVVG